MRRFLSSCPAVFREVRSERHSCIAYGPGTLRFDVNE